VIINAVQVETETPTITSVHRGFATAIVSSEPFRHVVVRSLFDDESCGALMNWLENDAEWEVQESGFYMQHRCKNLENLPMSFCRNAVDSGTLAAITGHLQEVFGTPLDVDNITISAHKLLPGQGIGIHTDQPEFGTETHRLVLHLCREFEDPFGGHLMFFHRRDPDAIAKIIRPLNNVAVGFELSDRSFHAVNEITIGVRYSLVFGFWVKGKGPTTKPPLPLVAAHERVPIEGGAALIAFLEQLGAREIPHSTRNLLAHLIGTSQIVARWGGGANLCKAALFHSVYGTTGFNKPLLSVEERPLLQEHIGIGAERLAFLFCFVDRLKIYEANFDGSIEANLRHTGGTFHLSSDDARDLRWLIAANVLEQAPYTQVTIEESLEIREELLAAADNLPSVAREEIGHAFAPPEDFGT
jgi:hypothetical protein